MPVRLFLIPAVTALIIVGGWLGQLLAVPPGYASPIWPPTGLALAALLLWGRNLWPAIWLGSFGLNLWIGSGATGNLGAAAVYAAIGIASGSTLQALAAVWLSEKFIQPGVPRLDAPRSILTFLGLTGPLACLIAPTIGVATLLMTGVMPQMAAFFSWWNWWVGDSIGVIVVTPLIFCFLATPHESWNPRRLTVALPLILMLLALVITFSFALREERSHLQLRFDTHAATIEKALTEHLDNVIDGIFSVRDYYQASANVERDEFSVFTKGMLAEHQELQALSWVPLVPGESLKQFEKTARSDGLADFRIVERNADGSMVPVQQRAAYFPVFFIEPVAGNEKALGFDLASDSTRQQALEAARSSGSISVTSHLQLVQDSGNQHGILVIVPVYANSHTHGDSGFKGFITGVVRINHLVDIALNGLDLNHLHVAIYDLNAPSGQTSLYSDATQQHPLKRISLHDRQKTFRFGDRSIRIVITPDESFVAEYGSLLPWITLFGGLVFTSLLSVYLLTITGRTARIQALVDETTRKLHASELQLRTIIETEPECVTLLAMNSEVLQMNPAGLRMVEADSLEQIIGKQLTDLVLPQYRDAFHTISQRVFNGESASLEFEIQGLKGSQRWLGTHAVPLRDAQGNITALLGLTHDITRRKQMETELRANEERFRSMLETSPIAVRIARTGGHDVVFANQRYEALINVESGQEIGKDPKAYYEHQEEYEDILRQLAEDRQIYNRLIELTIPGSGKKWALASYLLIQYEGEAAVLGWFYDVTSLKQTEDTLRRREEVFSAIVNQAADGIVLFDVNTLRFVEFNAAACNTLGYSPEEFSQLTLYDLQYKFSREQVAEGMRAILESGGNVFEHQHRRKDGSPQDLRASNRVVTIGGEQFVAAIWTDITARKREEEKLAFSARVFAEAHEGITITDAGGTIVDVNPTFCEITGYSREEVIGKNPRILSSGKHGPEFFADMWKTLTEQGHWQGELWNRRKDGEIYAELLTISALRDEDGNTRHYVGLFSDITQSKHQQQALELMAHYDVLTKLPNRVLFSDRFNQAIARAKRDESLLAVCYLDLDGFKQVNDTLGHEAGDQLLIEVAERIKGSLREEDTVSRLGGDEFAMLIGDISSIDHCEQALSRIHDSITQPYLIDGQSVIIAASTGVTLYPLDATDPDGLLRHADQAMYRAKMEGRNRFHLFDTAQDQLVHSQRQQLEAIEAAFSRNEFCLFYQPKVDMSSGDVIGAEALIRWRHPERGIVPPIEFLPVIEGTPFEIILGNWVIDQALLQVDLWNKQGLMLQVSVNISPLHLQWQHFATQLEATLAFYPHIPSHQLQLEVLESSVMGDLTAISDVLKTCRDALGVSIALDDFGTGYSSLTYLRRLPANTVKIDQSFVRDMIDDPNDYAIVEGVVGLASAFHREVIAEGVETRDHGLMLLTMGCTHAQGYGIARPMPADSMIEWVRNYQPDAKWRDYAQHPLTPDQANVMLLIIENHQWVKRMEESLQASPNAIPRWPIMNHEKCHCGRWLQQAEKSQLYDPAMIAQLNQAHQELHRSGNVLMQKFKDGNIEAAREGISLLHATLRTIEGMLSQLV